MYNYKNFINNILYLSIFLVSLISLTFDNLFLIWIFMEISSMIFISVLILSNNKISGIMYYFISFFSGSIIFFSILMMNLNFLNEFYYWLMFLSLILKLGLFPFNWWFNMISKLMSFNNLFIIMTLMKLIPFNLFYVTLNLNYYFLMIMIINLILMPIFMLNKNSLKLMLSYSSIYQSSMMLIIIYLSYSMFLFYFFIYFIMNYLILFMMMNLNNINNSNFILNNKKFKMLLFLNLLMYSYFPPMFSFVLKWSMLENLMFLSMNLFFYLMLIIMITSIFMLWNYLNFINNNIYNNNYFKMFLSVNYFKNWFYYLFNSIFIFLMWMYMFMNF